MEVTVNGELAFRAFEDLVASQAVMDVATLPARF